MVFVRRSQTPRRPVRIRFDAVRESDRDRALHRLGQLRDKRRGAHASRQGSAGAGSLPGDRHELSLRRWPSHRMRAAARTIPHGPVRAGPATRSTRTARLRAGTQEEGSRAIPNRCLCSGGSCLITDGAGMPPSNAARHRGYATAPSACGNPAALSRFAHVCMANATVGLRDGVPYEQRSWFVRCDELSDYSRQCV